MIFRSSHCWTFIAVSTCMGATLAIADDETSAREFPELTPEKCAESSPDRLYSELQLPGTASLRGEDHFYAVYQQRLHEFTDRHHPHAKRYRAEIHAAYEDMMRYVQEVWAPRGKLGHDDQRVGAWAEWVIHQGEKSRFQHEDDTPATAASVEQYALDLAARQNRHRPEFDESALGFLHKAIDHLIAATQEQGEPSTLRRSYFSRALHVFLKRYDVDEKSWRMLGQRTAQPEGLPTPMQTK